MRATASAAARAIPYPGTSCTTDISLIAHPAHTPAPSPFAALGSAGAVATGAAGGGVLPGDEGVRPADEAALRALYEALREVGRTAQETGIRVVVDAEHTWYQVGLAWWRRGAVHSRSHRSPSWTHTP